MRNVVITETKPSGVCVTQKCQINIGFESASSAVYVCCVYRVKYVHQVTPCVLVLLEIQYPTPKIRRYTVCYFLNSLAVRSVAFGEIQ